MTRVLCPVDLSESSRRAFAQAAAVATWSRATLAALFVYQPAPTVASWRVGPGTLPRAVTGSVRDALVGKVREHIAPVRGSECCNGIHVQEGTDVAGTIVPFARSMGTDLLVIGMVGQDGAQGMPIGSVTEKLLWKAPCPLLCVPDTSPAHYARVPYRTIVCAVDFFRSSLRALTHAADLARRGRSRLVVLNVVDTPAKATEPNADTLEHSVRGFTNGERSLDLAVATLCGGCEVSRLILAGWPGDQIVRTAAEQRADLVVIGVEGHTEGYDVVPGSTAHHVVRRSPCPVLLLRAN